MAYENIVIYFNGAISEFENIVVGIFTGVTLTLEVPLGLPWCRQFQMAARACRQIARGLDSVARTSPAGLA